MINYLIFVVLAYNSIVFIRLNKIAKFDNLLVCTCCLNTKKRNIDNEFRRNGRNMYNNYTKKVSN